MDKEDVREIFGLLRDIKADVAAIKAERKMDHERIQKVDDRLDKVESILDRAYGAKAIICAISSVVGAVVVVLVQWILARWH